MLITKEHLVPLITSLCERPLISGEINQLARICHDVATAFLRILEKQGKRIRETKDDGEFQGLAAECIADLFKRDDQGNLCYFQRYFIRKTSQGIQDDQLVIAFRRLITGKVQQYMSKIYAQRDPESAKLFRNIRLAAKRFEGIWITKDITGEFIGMSFDESEHDGILRPEYTSVRRIFPRTFRADTGIDQLVYDLLFLMTRTLKSPVELAVSDLVHLIREFRAGIAGNHDVMSNPDPLARQDELELERALHRMIRTLDETVIMRYVSHGKLQLREATAVTEALYDMAADGLQGRRLQENYDYLHKHWPMLTRDQYYNSFRNVFEYIVRLFKAEIKKR